MTVAVEPPELETRVAILMKKADQAKVDLPHDAAFFIAQRIRSNVRELEGALKRVIAHAHFMGRDITIELIRESLKDLLALQDKLVSVDNIQRTVAEYYKIKISDLLSAAFPFGRASSASGHGPLQGIDQPQPAGDRRRVRRSGSHHGAARLP